MSAGVYNGGGWMFVRVCVGGRVDGCVQMNIMVIN